MNKPDIAVREHVPRDLVHADAHAIRQRSASAEEALCERVQLQQHVARRLWKPPLLLAGGRAHPQPLNPQLHRLHRLALPALQALGGAPRHQQRAPVRLLARLTALAQHARVESDRATQLECWLPRNVHQPVQEVDVLRAPQAGHEVDAGSEVGADQKDLVEEGVAVRVGSLERHLALSSRRELLHTDSRVGTPVRRRAALELSQCDHRGDLAARFLPVCGDLHLDEVDVVVEHEELRDGRPHLGHAARAAWCAGRCLLRAHDGVPADPLDEVARACDAAPAGRENDVVQVRPSCSIERQLRPFQHHHDCKVPEFVLGARGSIRLRELVELVQ